MKCFQSFVKFALIAFTFQACGGGSDSSDTNFSRTFNGIVRTGAGRAISGAKVTVLGVNRETTTNAQGRFALSFEAKGPSVGIRVQDGDAATLTTSVRTDRSTKAGLNLVKRGTSLELLQGVDGALVASDDCRGVFAADGDLTQRAVTDDACTVTASADLSGSAIDDLSVRVVAERCPGSVTCPSVRTFGPRGEVTFALASNAVGEICEYRVEYRNQVEVVHALNVRAVSRANYASCE